MQFFERFLSLSDNASEHKLTVRLTSDQDRFVKLPERVANLYADEATPLVLKASQQGGPTCHVAWGGLTCYARDVIEISSALGQCLDLKDGQQVSISRPSTEIPRASHATVKPESVDDWEAVLLNQQEISEGLLSQGAVLEVGKAFPFWLGNRRPLILMVVSTEPGDVVRPMEDLEMFVEPQPREQDFEPEEESAGGETTPARNITWLRALATTTEEENSLEERRQSNKLACSSQTATSDTTSVRMSPATAALCGFQASGELIAVALSPYKSKVAMQLLVDPSLPDHHASVAAPVLASLQLADHHSAAFWSIPRKEQRPEALLLHAVIGSKPSITNTVKRMKPEALRELFCCWIDAQLANHKKLTGKDGRIESVPITDGTIMTLIDGQDTASFFLETKSNLLSMHRPKNLALLTRQKVERGDIRISVGEPLQLPGWPADGIHSYESGSVEYDLLPQFGDEWAKHYLHACLKKGMPLLHHSSRERWWRLQPPTPGSVLITGPSGSGKTSLANHVAHVVGSHRESLAHKVYLDCQSVDIESLAAARKQLEATFQEVVACMPSVLILDNLHMLCPAENPAPEQMAANSGVAALVQWLCEVLDYFSRQADGRPPLPVFTMATCPNASDVAPSLRAAGRLEQIINLQALGLLERQSLLAHAIKQRGMTCSPHLIKEAAVKADGHDASDLQALADRAVHSAVRRRIVQVLPGKERDEVQEADMEAAWRDFSPASSWGVGKGSGGNMVSGWEDVGGMPDVREALKEALELPTKYSKLLARAPLRLRTGVLLYGPPGCGKTHIISAAVAASGTRFLSVKGPELLNKYIGASEAAVRDLFRQASAAAPCVLFFDEFDAIAPKRGHDSTGVTDRVVNQLLTELDGVEGLKGVVVLAATSRPDLLDAALLRPGRLDRLMYCGMPTESDRLAILQALSRRLKLANDINLEDVAKLCEGYTGADLGALLSDAQLAGVHQLLEAQTLGAASKPAAKHKVTRKNVWAALEKSRPSLSISEQQRLGRIYSKFQARQSTGVQTEEQKEKPVLRATLG